MSEALVISIIAVVLTIIGLVSGFIYKIFIELKNIRSDEETKRVRFYQRLDEVKDGIKKEFTTQVVCHILHTQITRDLKEIKDDLKTLVNRNNG